MSFARFLFLCVTISLTLSPVYSKSGEKISSLPKKISQSVSPKISDRPAPKGPLVTDILINGNQNTAKQIILVSINTRVGGHLDEETLKNDVKSIYKLGYFQSPPKVLTERFRGGVRLVFTVEENPLVESITLEGNTLLATEDLLKEMTTSPGSVLNIRQLYEDLSLISSLYRKKGYIYSGIYNPGKQVNIEGTKIHIKIHESRISKILVEGNKKNQRLRDHAGTSDGRRTNRPPGWGWRFPEKP